MRTEGQQSVWKIAEPWAATFVAYREGGKAPDLERTLAELAANLDVTIDILEMHGAPDEKHPFSVVLQVPGLDTPVLFSCERAQKVEDAPPELHEQIQRCDWVLIGETLLSPSNPLETYAQLANVLARDERSLALLDSTTGLWLDRRAIEHELLDDTIPPPEELLWRTRVISASADLDSGTAWLFTSGLLRCGLPELEMLEVPASQARDAARLLDISAGLVLESGAPGSENALDIGEGIRVVLIPWQEAIEVLGADSLGTVEDREHLGEQAQNPLLATRAAVCDVDLRGSFKQVRTWPENALKAMAAEEAAVYTSSQSALRHGAIARRSWPRVVEAVSRAGEEELLVFVGLPVGTDSKGISEQGWIQVEEFRADGGSGRMLRDSGLGTPHGSRLEFTIEQLGAWRLVRGEQAIGPMDDIDPITFALGRS